MIFIFYLSASLAFLLGVSQIINSFAKKNWILSWLFFSMSFYLIKGVCLLTGTLHEYSHFFLIEIFITLSVGPLLYLYFNLLIEEDVFRKKRIYINFIPAILYLLFWAIHTLIIFFQQESFRDLNQNYEGRYSLLYALVPLSPAIYVFILTRKYYSIFRNNFFKEKWPIHIQIIFVLAMISCAIGILLGILTLTGGLDRVFFEWLYFFLLILLSGIVFYTFFISQKFPITFNIVSDTIKQIQYEKTTLKKVDVSGVEAKIKSLMEDEKVFQDEELSLKSLSGRLSMTPHQLSEFLNVKLNMNFNSLVNFYRVEEAKRLLAKRNDLIILNVAYESGFNSLSSFHTAFKKHVGISPNAFRKQSQKNKREI